MAKTPLKFKTREERTALCQAYIAHLAEGLSMASFPECSPPTMERYRRRFPRDFDEEAIERAEREGMRKWERHGIKGMLGQHKSFSAQAWCFNMKNRYGWRDKVEHFGEGASAPVRIEIVKPTAELYEQLKAQAEEFERRRMNGNGTGGHPNPMPINGGGNGTGHASS